MPPAIEQFWPDRRSERWRGRATRLTIAIVVHILAFIIAFALSPPILVKKLEPELRIFMLPSLEDSNTPKPAPRPRVARHSQAAPKVASAPVAPPAPLKMMVVSSDVFHAGDIARIHSSSDNPSPSKADAGTEQADIGTGEGPGGARLYNAEWYREPTDAELAYYLPKGIPRAGWGEIICRTVDHYHVDDCRELAEAPSGIGLARSMREAAWQFLVRPPRVGDKPLIGAWVRIRYDLIVGFKK